MTKLLKNELQGEYLVAKIYTRFIDFSTQMNRPDFVKASGIKITEARLRESPNVNLSKILIYVSQFVFYLTF